MSVIFGFLPHYAVCTTRRKAAMERGASACVWRGILYNVVLLALQTGQLCMCSDDQKLAIIIGLGLYVCQGMRVCI